MEEEVSTPQKQLLTAARLRSLADPSAPLEGSNVSAMALDAALVCFVAKVATELALTGTASALADETYGNEGHKLLDLVMSIQGCCFDTFFFSRIIQARGQGAMAALLGPEGPLHQLSWCQPWIDGGPTAGAEARTSLQCAEQALAEAEAEESRKAREIRLCPSCGCQFIVDQRRCGIFVCGRVSL